MKETGIRGSPFLQLYETDWDAYQFLAIDPMHQMGLGVVKSTFERLVDSEVVNLNNDWDAAVAEVSSMLPYNFSRLPTGIKNIYEFMCVKNFCVHVDEEGLLYGLYIWVFCKLDVYIYINVCG